MDVLCGYDGWGFVFEFIADVGMLNAHVSVKHQGDNNTDAHYRWLTMQFICCQNVHLPYKWSPSETGLSYPTLSPPH